MRFYGDISKVDKTIEWPAWWVNWCTKVWADVFREYRLMNDISKTLIKNENFILKFKINAQRDNTITQLTGSGQGESLNLDK